MSSQDILQVGWFYLGENCGTASSDGAGACMRLVPTGFIDVNVLFSLGGLFRKN